MRKNDIKIIFLIVIVVLFHDIFFSETTYIWKVNEQYVYSIFASLSTLSVLSVTILTIITNLFDNEKLGFTIREIINFKNEFINFSNIIIFTMTSIAYAAILLVYEFPNSMTLLLFIILYAISSMMVYIWRIITDDNFIGELIENQINRMIKENLFSENKVIDIFTSLNNAITRNGYNDIDQHRRILRKILNDKNTADKFFYLIANQFKLTFVNAIGSFGYIPAVMELFGIFESFSNGERNFHYDSLDMLLDPIKDIEFYDDVDFSKNSIFNIVNNLEKIKIDNLKEDDKIAILYWLFKATSSNEIVTISSKYNKMIKIASYLTRFTNFNDFEYERIKQKTLLYIVRDLVISNENKKLSTITLRAITDMFYENRYTKNDKYFDAISKIYMLIYFNSEYELEIFIEEHRRFLKSIFSSTSNGIYNEASSFQSLVKTNITEISKQLWLLNEDFFDNFLQFEARSPINSIKTVIFSFENGVNFLIMNYFLSSMEYKTDSNDFLLLLNNNSSRDFIIRRIVNCFIVDGNNILFSNETKVQLEIMSSWIKVSNNIPPYKQHEIFKLFNTELIKINTESVNKNSNFPNLELDSLNAEIISVLSNIKEYYGFNSALSLDNQITYEIRPFIQENHILSNIKEISKIVIYYIEDFINNYIIKHTDSRNISFNIDGVETLNLLLSSKNFKNRNYTFIDDWAINHKVRESEVYKELEILINEIKYVNVNPINEFVFFENGALDFNFKIIMLDYIELTDEECSIFAEKFKINEIMYKIFDSYIDKSYAINLIRLNYKKIFIKFKFISNVNNENCIRIKTIF